MASSLPKPPIWARAIPCLPIDSFAPNLSFFSSNGLDPEYVDYLFHEVQIMKQFYCDYCNEKISHFNGSIIKMKGVMTCDTFECVSNVYLPGELGHYNVIVDDFVKLKVNAKVDFRCPNLSCNQSFTTEFNDDLAEIKMIDGEREYVVVFNRIYGKQATFLVDYKEKKLEKSYGKELADYVMDFEEPVNFFGV